MGGLLDDAYSTADVMARMKPRRPSMPIETLSGRERRSVVAPDMPDPAENTKALAMGAGSIPLSLAGYYSPDLAAYHDSMAASYPGPYAVGSLGLSPGLLARILGAVPKGAAALGGLLFGTTANPKAEKDAR